MVNKAYVMSVYGVFKYLEFVSYVHLFCRLAFYFKKMYVFRKNY